MDKQLNRFQTEYDRIVERRTGSRKDFLLADLMTDMERAFRIPVLRSESYEKRNPEVITLYKSISEARSF